MKTHYETLRLQKDASAAQIKASYRNLVKLYHPDTLAQERNGHAEAEKRIRDINAAYAVLSKPLSRASYDAKLNRELPHPSAEPQRCANCGNPTTYWHTNRKAPLCHACTATGSETGENKKTKGNSAGG
jgi:DnaJ-class molecular chaperone